MCSRLNHLKKLNVFELSFAELRLVRAEIRELERVPIVATILKELETVGTYSLCIHRYNEPMTRYEL